jgi:hypothetical protein
MSYILIHQIIIYFSNFISAVHKINPKREASKYALVVASGGRNPFIYGVYLLHKYIKCALNCKIASWQGDAVN